MKYVGANEGSLDSSPLQEQKNCSNNNEEKGGLAYMLLTSKGSPQFYINLS